VITPELAGPLIQATALGTFLAAGRVLPRVTDQALVNRDTVQNVMNGVLLFGLRITLIAWISQRSEIGLLDLGLEGSPAIQLLVAFLVLDFSRYWLHYAHHRVSWLWTFHRVHHSAERLDATTGLRMHVVDFVQLSLLPVLLFVVLIDTHAWGKWVVVLVLGIGAAMDAFQHGNIRWNAAHPLAKAWNVLFNHPLFHSWHHTRDGDRCDGNYGNTLVIWDRIFRTEVTGPQPPALMGLEEDQALRDSLMGWHLLRPRSKG